MIKRFFLIACAAGLLLTTGSCRKYLDINDSPNAATTADPSLLFNYGATNYAATRAGGDLYVSLALAAQTIASGGNYGWGAANVYDVSIYSLGNVWKGYYSTTGNNLVQAIRLAESATPVNNNAAAQCKILLAQQIYEATVLWGDVPYSEAWNVNIPYPKFDAQRDVMNGVLGLLDSALAQMDMSGTSPRIAAGDLFYKGNMANWARVANGMKLRILMTMVDADQSKAAAIGDLVTGTSMLTSAAQNFQFPFYSESNKENPKHRLLLRYAGGENIFFFANRSVLDPMVAQNDPRLPQYFDKRDNSANFIGVNSEQEANDSTSAISAYLYRATAPELIFSYQEQLFLQAEAYARGIGVPQSISTADALYKQALTQACLYYEVSAGDAAAFVATKSLATATNAVDEIHLQQWIDLMDRPVEAFTNWRRSGPAGSEVPVLTLPPGAPNGPLFRRFVYPLAEEILPNPNAPKVLPFYYNPVWFDL